MPSEPGMEQLHGEMLSLLKEFHKICIENNIKYSLHGGTLLGAIREKGFIPWDDDIDVMLTRDEYNRLLGTLERRGKEYKAFVLRAKKLPLLVPMWKTEMPVWQDLFIYDYISERKLAQKCKIVLLELLSAMLQAKQGIAGTFVANYDKFRQICYFTAYHFGRLFPFAMKIKLFDWISQNAFCGNEMMIHRSNDQYSFLKCVFPKELMSEYVMVPFEDTELMVTKNYREVLVSSYGENYMTPQRMDAQHLKVHAVTQENITEVSRQRWTIMGSENK